MYRECTKAPWSPGTLLSFQIAPVHFEMPFGRLAKSLNLLLIGYLQKLAFQTAPWKTHFMVHFGAVWNSAASPNGSKFFPAPKLLTKTYFNLLLETWTEFRCRGRPTGVAIPICLKIPKFSQPAIGTFGSGVPICPKFRFWSISEFVFWVKRLIKPSQTFTNLHISADYE